jgi:hypothetical protein
MSTSEQLPSEQEIQAYLTELNACIVLWFHPYDPNSDPAVRKANDARMVVVHDWFLAHRIPIKYHHVRRRYDLKLVPSPTD